MIYCRNCGHESHCGITLVKEFTTEGKDIKEEIEVCKYCRCGKCMRPDWGQEDKMACVNEYCSNSECVCDPCECIEGTQDCLCECCD